MYALRTQTPELPEFQLRLAIERIRQLENEIKALKRKDDTLGKFLRVHQGNRILKVEIAQIQLIRADSNYSYIYLVNGERLYTSRTLKAFVTELRDAEYLRCHRSFLVNTSEIREIDRRKSALVLRDGSVIPVSRRYVRECVRTVFSGNSPDSVSIPKPTGTVHKLRLMSDITRR